MSTSKKVAVARAVFTDAANKYQALSDAAKLALESCAESEKKANKDTMQENATHAKYCMIVASQADAIFDLLLAQKVNLNELATSSRELKKRACYMLQAIVSKRAVDDRAFDNVLLRLAAKREKSLTIAQLQREMQHKTETQASYFKTFAEFFNFATYNKSEKTVTFNYDAYYLQELLQVYKAE